MLTPFWFERCVGLETAVTCMRAWSLCFVHVSECTKRLTLVSSDSTQKAFVRSWTNRLLWLIFKKKKKKTQTQRREREPQNKTSNYPSNYIPQKHTCLNLSSKTPVLKLNLLNVLFFFHSSWQIRGKSHLEKIPTVEEKLWKMIFIFFLKFSRASSIQKLVLVTVFPFLFYGVDF